MRTLPTPGFRFRAAAAAVLAAIAVSSMRPAAAAEDVAGAERQYRIARRLAAEGSPQARAALLQVVELAPTGPLADDALLEAALLAGVPEWPQDLGRIAADGVSAADPLLERILSQLPGSDRAPEARYRRALLRLEPLAGQDLAAARLDLITVATNPEAGEWASRARYAVAWLDRHAGRTETALAELQRLFIDDTGAEAATRAAIELGRIHLRGSAFGDAARVLEIVAERGGTHLATATRLRDLAVRGVLRSASRGGAWGSGGDNSSRPTPVRSIGGIATTAAGGVLVLDRKRGSVTRIGADGTVLHAWELPDVSAVAVDPLDRIWAAAGDRLYRLNDAAADPIASLGTFAPASAIAADALGTVWLADRRGEKLGRLAPGAAAPAPFWEAKDERLEAIAWDGRRLVALDGREDRLLEISTDGAARPLRVPGLQRPVAIAVDPAGEIAILEGKTKEVVLVSPDGEVRDRLATSKVGVARPERLALGEDGALLLFDDGNARVTRVP